MAIDRKIFDCDEQDANRIVDMLTEYRNLWLTRMDKTDERFGRYVFEANAGGVVAVLAYLAAFSGNGNPPPWQFVVVLGSFATGVFLSGLLLYTRIIHYAKLHGDAMEKLNGFRRNELTIQETMTGKDPGKIWGKTHHFSELGAFACVFVGLAFSFGWILDHFL